MMAYNVCEVTSDTMVPSIHGSAASQHQHSAHIVDLISAAAEPEHHDVITVRDPGGSRADVVATTSAPGRRRLA